MRTPDGRIMFGEWLPDLPFYENPGLVEARNCIPVDNHYKDYLPLLTAGDALPARCQGAVATTDTSGNTFIYAGTTATLQVRNGTAWTDKSGAVYTTASNGYWRFAQFDTFVVATNYADGPLRLTVGGGGNFAALATTGTAPRGRQVGVIRDFLMLGDTVDGVNGTVPARVQWSAIGDCTNWPAPNTAAAATVQSGEQFLNTAYGAVTAIANGEQFGLVFQREAINRFTYVGGNTVFQIQAFERARGCWAPQSMIQVGRITYFFASDGFWATDGQEVRPIGNKKVNKFVLGEFDQAFLERMTAGYDPVNNCIHWVYPNPVATSGAPNRVLIYNIREDRWSRAEDVIDPIFSSKQIGYTLDQLDSLYTSIDDVPLTLDSTFWQGGTPAIMGFSTAFRLGTLGGTQGTARFETSEIELNPGGLATVMGVKPLVTGAPTTITVAVGTRSAQDNASRTFGAQVSRNTRTGACDMRTTGNYHSARVEVTGAFDRALGVQFEAKKAGFP